MTMLNGLLVSGLWTTACALFLCRQRSQIQVGTRLGPSATVSVVLVGPRRNNGLVATATLGVLFAVLWGAQTAGVDLTAPVVGVVIDILLDIREFFSKVIITLLWLLIVVSLVALYVLIRTDANRMTERGLLALGRSWIDGRSGIGRLGRMVIWTNRVAVALFVASLIVTGGGEFARQLDEVRVGVEAQKQSEAVYLRGLAGAVGAQRQGKEDGGDSESEEELLWWEEECEQNEASDGTGTNELCDAFGMSDLIARVAIAFEAVCSGRWTARTPCWSCVATRKACA